MAKRPGQRPEVSNWLAPILALALLHQQQQPLGASQKQDAAEQRQTIARQLVEIPVGSIVELRLLNKSKLQGRLSKLDPDGVEIQVAQAGVIKTQTVPINDVKSVKRKDGKGGGRVALYILAGVGVALSAWILVALILIAGD